MGRPVRSGLLHALACRDIQLLGGYSTIVQCGVRFVRFVGHVVFLIGNPSPKNHGRLTGPDDRHRLIQRREDRTKRPDSEHPPLLRHQPVPMHQ